MLSLWWLAYENIRDGKNNDVGNEEKVGLTSWSEREIAFMLTQWLCGADIILKLGILHL